MSNTVNGRPVRRLTAHGGGRPSRGTSAASTTVSDAPPRRQRPGTAAYANGQDTAAAIIATARRLVIDHGIAQFSMRRLAREMGVSPGNLGYYYAAKQDLLEDVFTEMLVPFLVAFEALRKTRRGCPEAELRAVLEYVYDDLQTRETTHFFPELWVMALRDDWATAQMERIYSTYRSVLIEIIEALRPDLDAATHQDLALTISATIEGHTVFVGHGRSQQPRAGSIRPLIIEQLMQMVRTAGRTDDDSAGAGGVTDT